MFEIPPPLPRDFCARSALRVARDCIGKWLVKHNRDDIRIGRIVEVEAYVGVRDRACHAYAGHRSPRNESMYGPAGHAYVFQTDPGQSVPIASSTRTVDSCPPNPTQNARLVLGDRHGTPPPF